MVPVQVRHEAEVDALSYFEHIYRRNPDAAFRFMDAIDKTVEGLKIHPLKGRLRLFRGKNLKNIRSWRVDGFETYLLFYRFDGKLLDILRIRHGAMRFPTTLTH